MDISLKSLEEALSIRRQISTLEKRLAAILEISVPSQSTRGGRARISAATRAKLFAAAKARWAKLKRSGVSETARKKGGLTPAGRKAKPAFSNGVRYGREVNEERPLCV
jgi:hypothetical protein